MGQFGAAGEGQADPSKDQEVQDQTRTDEPPLSGGEKKSHCGSAGAVGPLSPGSLASDRVVLLQDEEPFNPDYVEVDRILDVSHSVDKDNGEVTLFAHVFYKRA